LIHSAASSTKANAKVYPKARSSKAFPAEPMSQDMK